MEFIFKTWEDKRFLCRLDFICNEKRGDYMGIIYNRERKTITLHTKNTSYQMKIANLDYLIHLYYGPAVCDADMSYQIKQYDRGFSGNPYESRNARKFSLDAQPQEFTTQQQGDFRLNGKFRNIPPSSSILKRKNRTDAVGGRICIRTKN